MKTGTLLTILALGTAAAAVAMGGDGDDDEKEPKEPNPDEDEPDEGPAPVDPDAPTQPLDPIPDPPLPDPMDIPVPQGDAAPESLPRNFSQLESAADFTTWGIARAVEPDANALPVPRTVILGYAPGWFGRPLTVARLVELARKFPDVNFAAFSFVRSKELFGEPTDPLGYVLTAVYPDGRARALPLVGKKKTLGPISPGELAKAVSDARHGPGVADAEFREARSKAGALYTVLLKTNPQGAWQWGAWEGSPDGGPANVGSGFDSKGAAWDAARAWIATVQAYGVSVAG